MCNLFRKRKGQAASKRWSVNANKRKAEIRIERAKAQEIALEKEIAESANSAEECNASRRPPPARRA